MAPVVELHDIHHSYGAVETLRAVSFSLADGEVVGLVGENGAGKSTIVKILTGVVQPIKGNIIVKGAERELVEIAKGLSIGAQLLILDEPTAVLSAREVAALYKIVRNLKARGVTVLFISHRLEEVYQWTDRVIVLRDGQKVAEKPTSEVTIPELIRDMVGREISTLYPKQPARLGDTVLEVRGLTQKGYFEDVSFTLRQGEILGFAGLVG